MRVLGVDTATRRATVAVVEDDLVLAEVTVDSSSHTTAILPLIDAVLQEGGCGIESVEAIAVSAGPGSFTGLRVGLSVAQGIACATGAQVVPISTLEALAHAAPMAGGAVCPLLDARMGEVYAACFERAGTEWRTHLEARLLTPERLVTTLPAPCTILGDAVVRYGTFLAERLGHGATVLPWPEYGPRASIVARLALARLRSGIAAAGRGLEPFYVRAPDAQAQIR